MPAASAQDRTTDPELEALVPDAAVANPEGWVQTPPPPLDIAPALDPASPLSEATGITLPWPDAALDLPALASLPPDPDVAETLATAPPLPGGEALPEGDVDQISPRLALVFPADNASFPERAEFEARFKDLSSIENLGGDSDNPAQVGARAKVDRDLLIRLLRIYGYYDADVIQTVGGIEPGQEQAQREVGVRFYIQPGQRYRFGAIDLGALPSTGPDYPMLRESFAIKTGDPVNSDQIVLSQGALDLALAENGYAFQKVGEPDLLIDHARQEGDLTLPVQPGGKYAFGPVISQLPKFLSSRHLERIARFDRGDIYKRSESEDLRRAILATGLVASVTVTPRETRAPAEGQPGEVALDIGMTKAKLRTIAGLLGYDSEDGFRLEASWEHRNLLPPEGMLRVRGIAGTKEQLAGVTFRKNNFLGRDQVLTFDLYANTIDRTAYKAKTVAFSTIFEKVTTLLFQKPWTWSAGVQIVATDEAEGALSGQRTQSKPYYIAALPLAAAYDGSDDLLDPTRGFRAGLRVSPEISRFNQQNSFYARIQADVSAYKQLGSRVVMAARTRLGSIPGTDIVNVAPSRRFYAGGGASVRGYGYQMIGPQDTLGQPTGGRSLAEFSLEARVRTGFFGGALSVVPFIDAGAVNQSVTPSLSNLRFGTGIGVRYKTGFGPIRVDVGTPLNPRKGDSRIAVYVSLGQAF